MQTHRWINKTHPRYLQNAVVFLYMTAAFALLFNILAGGAAAGIGLPALAGVAGGYGIANDKKWGYYLSVVVAILPLALDVFFLIQGASGVLNLNIIFQIILVVLLLDKSSREYVRIWFK